MKLYIQVKDGNPINHPALEENLLQAFETIPDDWEPFIRRPPMPVGLYQVIDGEHPIYAKVNGVWTDVWIVRNMTADEKLAIQQPVHDMWANRPYASNFTTWVYNEAANTYEPPFPRPDDAPEGFQYRWNGADNNWKLAPVFPDDGKVYKFDFDNWVNVEVLNVQS